MPLLVPISVITAVLTLKSDTQPVKIYVKKPRGTLYWGGAGLDGPYIQPTLKAFQAAGIKNVFVGLTNSASNSLGKDLAQFGTIPDALRAGLAIRYEDDGEWTLSSGMDASDGQFNLIGYSYGSLLAAQTANFYAQQGHIIDHLVLVASPIDESFLKILRSRNNIKKIVILNLDLMGDPIYAGIKQLELVESSLKIKRQMDAGKGEGHFYYAHVVADSPRRWKILAERLVNEGLR